MRSLVLAVACLSCASAPSVSTSGGYKPGWYAVHFSHAVLAARRPDGSPWHVTAADNSAVAIGGLLGLLVGDPSLGVSIGESLAAPGGDPLAPAPYVVIKLAGRTYRITASRPSYSPTWLQSVALDGRNMRGDEVVVVQAMDGVDDSLIAQTQLALSELTARPTMTFTNLGAVASLDVDVRPLSPRRRVDYVFEVPSNLSPQALLKERPHDWQPIPIWNGDQISVSATGSVCPSTLSDECFGPGGAEPGRWASYNLPGLENAPHASLVALLPGAVQEIGDELVFDAEQSGIMLLLVNDTDIGNNHGAFLVYVHVNPPN